jgi:penicillin V acylase-like amidase (Ntn superfamily)
MNEHGLVISMALVPETDTLDDPSKDRMTSLVINREILDHARAVDEAVVLIGNYNISLIFNLLIFGIPGKHFVGVSNAYFVAATPIAGQASPKLKYNPGHKAS